MSERDPEAWRRGLRQHDPYGGEDLPVADAARIRARLREAAGRRARQPRWAPAFLTLAALAALVVWLAGPRAGTQSEPSLPGSPTGPSPASAPAESAVAPTPAPISPPAVATAVTVPDPPDAAVLAALGPRRDEGPAASAGKPPAATGSPVAEPSPAAFVPVAEGMATGSAPMLAEGAPVAPTVPSDRLSAPVRRVRFTAPRGTRIIWSLDPGFGPEVPRKGAPPARRPQGANDK